MLYYKVLVEGRAPHMRTAWSIPVRGIPGEWMSVDGPLKRCGNGLHLTSDPVHRRVANAQCYLAETEGETIGPFGDELVARKARLVKRVAWSEFKWVDPDPDVDPTPVVAKEDSPALSLLKHIWKHEGHGAPQSWARLNGAMGSALGLAIRSGLRFDVEDFATFAKDFNSCRWIGDAEWCYSAACGAEHGDHGGNPSAVQSFEAWTGRKPFLIRHEPTDKTPKRLYVGSRFRWWDGEKLAWVYLTSFDDSKATCVAVERKHEGGETKVIRRHTLTHDKIKAYHAEIKARLTAAKATAEATSTT